MAAQDILYQLQSSGLYEIALPFLLIFTITFAILEKTKIFGAGKDQEPRSNINVVVSVILGLLIINQFEIVDRLNLFLPKVSLFIVVAIMFLILLGVFGANISEGFSGILLLIFAIVSLFVIYWALTPYVGLDFIGPYWLESWVYDNSSTLIFLVIIGIIIWAVVKKPRGNNDTFTKFGETIDKMFGKGSRSR
ncbi:MAG: hypothetical protein QT11_C0001G0242 [archaeon GW2011_AR20]|nr:MAG: hypothetical protein QT11_C0001G0242 [archaeon GW2011_AR20]AQS28412.1 hypothetical protein [uncultured archaeon]MBS3160249.1 hypothetical protein [Candidatus Woesearchaeota archaeon]